jgi:hypothetical protein
LGGAIAGGVIGGVVMGVVAATMGNAGLTVLLPGMIALVAVFIPIGYRLSVKLPAVALGRRDYGLPNAWTDTKGNFWRFLGLGLLYFIVALIVAVAAGLLGLGLGYIGGGIGLSISIAVQLAVNWVLTILGVTMLTSLYGFFVEGRQF